jgi:hypothetical protein
MSEMRKGCVAWLVVLAIVGALLVREAISR